MRNKNKFCPLGHEFNKENTYVTKGGYNQCKVCVNISVKKTLLKYPNRYNTKHRMSSKIYREKNKDKVKEKIKEWTKKNLDKKREYDKEWVKNNRDRVNENANAYQKRKRIIDISYRISQNIGIDIWHALKDKKYSKRWQILVGFSTEELIKHLENQFDDKMNWNNYGSYWHIDHIKPRSLFKFTTHEDKEFKECWALSNLQPLEKIENIKKGNKYVNSV